MITIDDVKHLASLARLSVPEAELDAFVKEFDGILKYIGQLEKLPISVDSTPTVPPLHNVFREDGEPTPEGTNTETITSAFPHKKGNSLSVKKIL